MIGNGNHTTHKNGDDWGMAYYCFTYIIGHFSTAVFDDRFFFVVINQ